MIDVVLVHMPYSATEHPSIALGLLQAELRAAGLRCRTLYPNLDFCAEIGMPNYHALSGLLAEDLVGEWTFAGAAFPDFEPDHETFFAWVFTRSGLAGLGKEKARTLLTAVRQHAPAFIERISQEIASLKPRLVGASSTFQQHCASLALMRRLKELDAGIVTCLGGANCEGPMGVATIKSFPWIDYAVSGEADGLFADFCRALLLAGEPSPLPEGILSRDPLSWNGPPRAILKTMDNTAVPDYDDYFQALSASPLGPKTMPGLLLETSRGCWWGQKHHCTFCGLNGAGMGYRSKSAERVLQEMESLSSRYGLRSFEVVDNILDHAHMKSILPALAEREPPYDLFYETKSNLRREQVQLLARAGVRWIQPGIESLHDEVLKLMAKGSTALMNVQLLKWCREFGVRAIWNFLTCFPGEQDVWYLEMARWLPLIEHLQPANAFTPVRYDRFSPYHTRPESFGIQIRPARTYASVYPLSAEVLADLAYFFEDQSEPWREERRLDTPGRTALQERLKEWKDRFWSTAPSILSRADDGTELRIRDSRRVAVRPLHVLSGLARDLLLECDLPQSRSSLAQRFPGLELQAALEDMVDSKLLLHLDGRYLNLTVGGSLPRLPWPWEFPGGFPNRPDWLPAVPLPHPVVL